MILMKKRKLKEDTIENFIDKIICLPDSKEVFISHGGKEGRFYLDARPHSGRKISYSRFYDNMEKAESEREELEKMLRERGIDIRYI